MSVNPTPFYATNIDWGLFEVVFGAVAVIVVIFVILYMLTHRNNNNT